MLIDCKNSFFFALTYIVYFKISFYNKGNGKRIKESKLRRLQGPRLLRIAIDPQNSELFVSKLEKSHLQGTFVRPRTSPKRFPFLDSLLHHIKTGKALLTKKHIYNPIIKEGIDSILRG